MQFNTVYFRRPLYAQLLLSLIIRTTSCTVRMIIYQEALREVPPSVQSSASVASARMSLRLVLIALALSRGQLGDPRESGWTMSRD
ncbi:hypothetical protein C8Q74DRAFT_1247627, partial [Fomes fomentarius]